MHRSSALLNRAHNSVSKQQQAQYQGLTAHERHTKHVHDYLKEYGSKTPLVDSEALLSTLESDYDALAKKHRFIRSASDDAENSWDARLAKRYYERLFKEYCIADLSLYKQGRIGLRWRTEKEVVDGKGQFTCAAKGCSETVGLCSYEVNFGYQEGGQRKQALVKLRLCPRCAYKLNYKKEHKKHHDLRNVLQQEHIKGGQGLSPGLDVGIGRVQSAGNAADVQQVADKGFVEGAVMKDVGRLPMQHRDGTDASKGNTAANVDEQPAKRLKTADGAAKTAVENSAGHAVGSDHDGRDLAAEFDEWIADLFQ